MDTGVTLTLARCSASNYLGKASSSARVTVETDEPPRAPSITTQPRRCVDISSSSIYTIYTIYIIYTVYVHYLHCSTPAACGWPRAASSR